MPTDLTEAYHRTCGSNTILLTLAALDTVQVTLELTGTSLASFVVSSFIAGHVGHAAGEVVRDSDSHCRPVLIISCRIAGDRVRWWLLLSCFLQLVFLSAIVITSYLHPDFIIGPHNWVVMMALACSAGIQVAMVSTQVFYFWVYCSRSSRSFFLTDCHAGSTCRLPRNPDGNVVIAFGRLCDGS
jgi:hypothetical protein